MGRSDGIKLSAVAQRVPRAVSGAARVLHVQHATEVEQLLAHHSCLQVVILLNTVNSATQYTGYAGTCYSLKLPVNELESCHRQIRRSNSIIHAVGERKCLSMSN